MAPLVTRVCSCQRRRASAATSTLIARFWRRRSPAPRPRSSHSRRRFLVPEHVEDVAGPRRSDVEVALRAVRRGAVDFAEDHDVGLETFETLEGREGNLVRSRADALLDEREVPQRALSPYRAGFRGSGA